SLPSTTSTLFPYTTLFRSAKDGSTTTMPEITVHAVWWEQGPALEWARYAMITVDHSDVTVDNVQNLTDFVSHADPFLETPSPQEDRKSTRLNSSHRTISYA